MHSDEQKLYQTLKDLDIKFKKLEHPSFGSVKESGNFYQENDFGLDCKSIFLRTKQGHKHYLVVLQKDKTLDIPLLAEFLGEHRKMGFASDERLFNFLGLKPGSVTPFAIINGGSEAVDLILDKDIFEAEFVHFHPLRNTASLKISSKDFKNFLDNFEHIKHIVEINNYKNLA